MSKVELVRYMADLLRIGQFLNEAGVSHGWLNREAQAIGEQIETRIKAEQEKADEATRSSR